MNNTNTEYTVKGEYISPSCGIYSVKIETAILSLDTVDGTIDAIGINDYLESIW